MIMTPHPPNLAQEMMTEDQLPGDQQLQKMVKMIFFFHKKKLCESQLHKNVIQIDIAPIMLTNH